MFPGAGGPETGAVINPAPSTPSTPSTLSIVYLHYLHYLHSGASRPWHFLSLHWLQFAVLSPEASPQWRFCPCPMLPLHGTSQVYLPTFFEVLTSCSLPKELWAETPVSKWLLRANLGRAIEIKPGQLQTCTRQKWHNHEHPISITNTYRHCEGG